MGKNTILVLAILFGLADVASASSPLIIKHYQKQARYTYGAELLDLALSKLQRPYKIIAPEKQNMNEGRGELEVVLGNLDLQWMSTTSEREDKMIPIRIPIYRGIMGLRLLLIQKDRLEEMSQIKSLSDLRKYKGVHGTHWGDLPVYAANNLSVHTHVKYESLFSLLSIGRVHYFHRGLNEIWGEIERYQDSLTIADGVMLYYPLPVYYFVTKSKPDLAQMLERGLRMALEDGSFEQHFLNFHSGFIAKGNLPNRQLIRLVNPDLPEGTPSIDTSWWLDQNL